MAVEFGGRMIMMTPAHIMMTPAQHYAAACGLLASADGSEYPDAPDVLYAVQSATAHAILACVDPQTYSDAKQYLHLSDGRVRHIVAEDSVETGGA